MTVTAMGKAGLSGAAGKMASVASEPIAKRTPISRDQIMGMVGWVMVGMTVWRTMKLLRRVWAARNET